MKSSIQVGGFVMVKEMVKNSIWNEFKSTITCLNFPHIICLSETWFNVNCVCNLSGYKLFYKNRETTRGGGVAIYIRNDMTKIIFYPAKLKPKFEKYMNKIFIIFFKITLLKQFQNLCFFDVKNV